MNEYDILLEEVRAKLDFYRRTIAREYVPRMFRALRDENLTPEDARDRIEKDCRDMWEKRTILEFLPEEAKDPKKQESGRLGQKKRKSAAVSAAQHQEKEAIVIDTKGRPVEDATPSTPALKSTLPRSCNKNQNNTDLFKEVELCVDLQEISRYISALAITKSLETKIQFRVRVDIRTLQVVSYYLVKRPEIAETLSRLEQEELSNHTPRS